MPQNMQKKSNSVASLDDDEAVAEVSTVEKAAQGNTDTKYQQALRYLEQE